jgi:hemerythrin-like domain-containing protein
MSEQEIEYSKITNIIDYIKAFQEIDDWSYGYIDTKNLISFLRKHGIKSKNLANYYFYIQ